MVRVEIIKVDRDFLRAAFYYPVPEKMRTAFAADANRVPAATKLSAQEVQAFKDGHLTEELKDLPIDRVNQDERSIQAVLEAHWSALREGALRKYSVRYVNRKLLGLAWDGTNWS